MLPPVAAATAAAAVAVERYHLPCRALSSSLSHPLYDRWWHRDVRSYVCARNLA